MLPWPFSLFRRREPTSNTSNPFPHGFNTPFRVGTAIVHEVYSVKVRPGMYWIQGGSRGVFYDIRAEIEHLDLLGGRPLPHSTQAIDALFEDNAMKLAEFSADPTAFLRAHPHERTIKRMADIPVADWVLRREARTGPVVMTGAY